MIQRNTLRPRALRPKLAYSDLLLSCDWQEFAKGSKTSPLCPTKVVARIRLVLLRPALPAGFSVGGRQPC